MKNPSNPHLAIAVQTMTHVRKKPVVVHAVRVMDAFEVNTLEGKHEGRAGDVLIMGVNGELYPCKPDIFDKTYEQNAKDLPMVTVTDDDDDNVLP